MLTACVRVAVRGVSGVRAGRGFAGMLLVLLAWAGTAYAGGPAATTTSTLTVTVGGSAVTTVQSGTAVVLTATVKVGSTALTHGIVQFVNAAATHCARANLLATAQITSAGTATYKFFPGPGVHTYGAVFLPQTAYAGSSSTGVALTVTGGHSVTASLTSSGSAGAYTLTGKVQGSIAAFPTGVLTFQDVTNGGSTVGTATLGPYSSTYTASLSNPTIEHLPVSVGAGDLNGDGYPDLVVGDYEEAEMSILLNNKNGTYTTTEFSFADPTETPYGYAFGDFNGDGRMDIAVLDSDSTENYISILLGNGSGGFTEQPTFLQTGTSPENVVAADPNGDGILDLALASYGTNSIEIWLGKGDGTFTAASPLNLGSSPTSVAAGDFNDDCKVDLAVTLPYVGYGGVVQVFLGSGTGTFAAGNSYSAVSYPNDVVVADLNGDGFDDLAVPDYNASQVLTWLGNGAGSFTPGPAIDYPGTEPYALSLGDLNGDGTVDMAVADFGGDVTVLLGDGTGNFIAPATPATVGSSVYGVATADFNQDGIVDWAAPSFDDSTLTVGLSASGTTASASASISGVALPGSGTVDVDVSYPGDGNYAAKTSSQIALTGSQVTTALSVGATPSGSSAFGQQVTLTAALSPYSQGGKSTDGETVTFYSGGSSVGMGTLSSGVATLTTTLPAGTDTITAQYAGDTNFIGSTATGISYVVVNPPVMTLSFVSATAIGASAGLNWEVDKQTSTASQRLTNVGFQMVLPAGLSFELAGSSEGVQGGTKTYSADGSTLTVTGVTLGSSTSGFSAEEIVIASSLGEKSVSSMPTSGNGGNGATVTASLNVLPGVWAANGNGKVSEFATDGTVVSPTGGYTSVGSPTVGVAVNENGNVYSLSHTESILTEFTGHGTDAADSSAGQAGLNNPTGVAIDGANQIWVSNNDGSLTAFYSPITTKTATGSRSNATSTTGGLTIDSSGNAWVTDTSANTVTEFLGAAAPTQVLAAATETATEGSRPY